MLNAWQQKVEVRNEKKTRTIKLLENEKKFNIKAKVTLTTHAFVNGNTTIISTARIFLCSALFVSQPTYECKSS